MKTSFRFPRLAFWGLMFIGAVWLVLTLQLETHLSAPLTAAGWLKRLTGWGVELCLAFVLVRGIRRCAAAGQK